MNKKKLIALQAVVITVATVGAEASETRWHVGIDVGMAQYKQERKQVKYPTYKEVQKMLDEAGEDLQKIVGPYRGIANAVQNYHNDLRNQKVVAVMNDLVDDINNVNTNTAGVQAKLAQQLSNINNMLQANGNPVLVGGTPQVIANGAVNNMNLGQAKNQAIQYLQNLAPNIKMAGLVSNNYGVSTNDFSCPRANNVANVADNEIALINTMKQDITNYMNQKHHKIDDVVDAEIFAKYKHAWTLRNSELATALMFDQTKWALENQPLQTWLGANWYGVGQNPADKQALIASLEQVKKAKENSEAKALSGIEKTSSNRITSPAVEANFGVTRQFGKGVLGAEVLVGVNCKEFGKKKKTDIYKQKKTPVYGAGIVRAGFMLGDRAEVYALGGVRFNGLSPIVGGGARFYSPTKSYFFKAEFQKTLGKKYPKGHTIKLGMGWTI